MTIVKHIGRIVTGLQGYKVTRLQGYRVTGLRKNKNFRISYKNSSSLAGCL
jgi:hypothetical protein